MADDLMIEVTGSAKTAESALDRVTKKLETLKETFDRLAPSVKEFTDRMNSIASSSKAISSLKKITESTQRSALSAKDAESRMAMYQARLDRATLSMNKTRVASERLAAAQRKLNQASGIDAANQAFLNSFKYKGPSGVASSYLPTPDTTPSVTPFPGSSRLASSIVDAQSTAQKAAFNINTTPALTKLQEVQAYIDSLTPSITEMSSKAQADFQGMATKLTTIAQQIDNQRAMWSKLASAQGQAASKFGENSNQALKLEKQMLSADSAIGRLIDKQDKLKTQMSQITDASKKTSAGFWSFGKAGEDSAKKSVSGMTKLLRMVKSVTISLLTFKALTAIQQGFQTGIQNIAQASSEANYYLSAIATSSLYMKNSLGAALMPVIQALTPYITGFTDALANLFNTIGMLTARIFNGATSVTIAKKANVDYAASLGKSNTAAKELQRTIAGFDEINALSKPSSDSASSATAGMPDVGTMFETVDVPKWANKIGGFTDKVKKLISGWWNDLTDSQKWGAGVGATAGATIGGIVGKLIGGPMGAAIGIVLGGVVGTVIGAWWAGLTTPEKWAVGIGATAGALIGGIVGGLLTTGNPIGIAVGSLLGATAGTLIGKWWADLTLPEKWGAGIGAGAGTIIGGIIGGILTGGNPIGIAVGVALGGTVGAIIGQWWTDLTTPEKWGVGIGAGAGSVIGGIIGSLIGGPIGTVIGVTLGGTIGTIIGKWWADLTTQKKWSVGIGAGAGATVGGIIGGLIGGPIGVAVGGILGGTIGTIIGNWWDTFTTKQKWQIGTAGIGSIIGGFIGTILFGPLGTILGVAIGDLAGSLIEKFWDFLSNKNNWKIGKGVGIAATIGGIIGAIIGGPLGAAIGAAIAGGTAFVVSKYVSEHANGTSFHPGGPALVNDQVGPVFRELIQFPNGTSFLPKGRNVFLPDMPAGTKVLSAMKTKQMFSNYANGIGTIDTENLLPRFSMEDLRFNPKYEVNSDTFSSVSSGISGSNSIEGLASQIASGFADVKASIEGLDLNIKLYANNREIAESANAGNRLLDRARHSVAST